MSGARERLGVYCRRGLVLNTLNYLGKMVKLAKFRAQTSERYSWRPKRLLAEGAAEFCSLILTRTASGTAFSRRQSSSLLTSNQTSAASPSDLASLIASRTQSSLLPTLGCRTGFKNGYRLNEFKSQTASQFEVIVHSLTQRFIGHLLATTRLMDERR